MDTDYQRKGRVELQYYIEGERDESIKRNLTYQTGYYRMARMYIRRE